jgi:uncharacterized protein YndB with AHSA1/START domain
MALDHSAQLKAHLEASPERVWHALTDADALTAWYWPPSVQPRAVSDARAGGAFGISTTTEGMGFSGTYREFDPPRRMVQSWRWAGEDTDSRVTIELTPAGGGTDLLIVHDLLDEQTAEMYRQGWASCLDRLPGHLA